jgi:hypothetical protein
MGDHEASRQGGYQIALSDKPERHHEIRDHERHAPREALSCERRVNKAVGITGERYEQMMHLAISLQGRGFRKGMSFAHANDEVLFIQDALNESRRHVV